MPATNHSIKYFTWRCPFVNCKAFKSFLKIAVIIIALLPTGNSVYAQSKVGYINLDELISQMPESKEVTVQIEALKQSYAKMLTDSVNPLIYPEIHDSKIRSEAERLAMERKLQEAYDSFQRFQKYALREIDLKRKELNKPMVDKVRAAIAEVAMEKGYSIIINTPKEQLLVFPEEDNLMGAVRMKLGLR